MDIPPPQLLADVYWRLPFLVVHLTVDGIVLHANPETARITGYDPSQLAGKNFWATLFPGRLFAQIPKFISASAPSPLLKDTPLTLRTRQGGHRIIGFTRFLHSSGPADAADSSDSTVRTMVCIGVDLTDRLLAADKQDQPGAGSDHPPVPFGPYIGNGGAIEGEIVTPIAITPPAPRAANADGSINISGEAIRQVHEFLTEMDLRMDALQVAHARGELDQLAHIAGSLSSGAHACGLLEFSARAGRLQLAASASQLEPVNALIRDILALYRADRR